MQNIWCFLLLLVSCQAVSAAERPFALGSQAPQNRHLPLLELVYFENFESGNLPTLNISGAHSSYTSELANVVEGRRSLLVASDEYVRLSSPRWMFQPNETVLIEVDYRRLQPLSGSSFEMGLGWSDFDPSAEGAVAVAFNIPERGTHQHHFRLPAEVNDCFLQFIAQGADFSVDKLRIYRHSPHIFPAEPNMLKMGFPRLSNYHVYAGSSSAILTGQQRDVVEEYLGRFDLVHGGGFDYTLGNQVDYLQLKRRNPDILILPYQQTFMAVQTDPGSSALTSAGLQRMFNEGLAEDWFMKNPEGERLAEVLYPDNLQLNHTAFCPVVDGLTFQDYMLLFLGQTLFPSGYFDGIHFDQSEWYVNPLLGNGDPFNNQLEVFVPIDLDNDGDEETLGELYTAWFDAFQFFFFRMDQMLGPSALFFGNGGEMPMNPSVIERLNGFLNEFYSPYARKEDGTYDTNRASYFYRFLNLAQLGEMHLRAPQIPSTQMTGVGLGTPTGTETGNGVPDREPSLVPLDYQRARFGLAATLMTDGFFGYDFVDNTTAPLAWFDEYSVDLTTGDATGDATSVHYLGQPLGKAVELDYPAEEIVRLDFEPASVLPPGVVLGDDVFPVSDSALVLEGEGSLVAEFTADIQEPNAASFILSTIPEILPLEESSVYQLFADYRILDYNPVHFRSFLSQGLINQDVAQFDKFTAAALFYRDIMTGMQGQLRASLKTDAADFRAILQLSDTGVVALDNIRLIKGTGGVFRRDFENGIALLNPTPESQALTLNQITGPLNRTGVRRINGTQEPGVNSGESVTASLELEPGQGLILLADEIAAAPPSSPQNLAAKHQDGGARLAWEPSNGTVAGYCIRYGFSQGGLLSYKMVGKTSDAYIPVLQPGRSYAFQIAAHDYLGNLSEYTEPVILSIPGEGPDVIPLIQAASPLKTGEAAFLSGENLVAAPASANVEGTTRLNGCELLCNGAPVDLLAVSPSQIDFIVPSNLGGDWVIIEIARDGVISPARRFPLTTNLTSQVLWTRLSADKERYSLGWKVRPNTRRSLKYSSTLSSWSDADVNVSALTGYTEAEISSTEPQGFLRLEISPSPAIK